MKNKNLIFLFLILAIIFALNCERKFTGWGKDEEIRVLADSTSWVETENLLRDVFEKPMVTPRDESVFTIHQGNIENFKRYKNLIFIATLKNDDAISTMVKNSLSPDVIKKIESGNYVFIQKSKWATYQMVMFLVADSLEYLKNRIDENKHYLFSLFDDYWNDVRKEILFRFAENVEVEKSLSDKYGWMLRLPYGYYVFNEDSVKNFVLFHRNFPDRYIFVHWINSDDPSIIEKEWCIQKRNDICDEFLSGDKVEQKFVSPKYEEVEFCGRRASRLEALWRNDERMDGGPFVNYCFYDEHSQRIYMVDFAMFDPRIEKQKRHHLRLGNIILHTFKTKEECSADQEKILAFKYVTLKMVFSHQIKFINFKINIPDDMVIIDPKVDITMMLPANSLLQPMASAITNVAMAVGVANRINKTPMSSPVNPM